MLIRNVKGAVLAAAIVLGASGAVRADFSLTTLLSGANERPLPSGSPATGSATISYASLTNTLSYSITFNDLTGAPGAGHIHVGGVNDVGPVILPLSNLPAAPSGTFSGTLTAANLIPRPAVGINTFSDAIAAIAAGNAYVNLHTARFPGGEIRGQLPAAPGGVVPEPGTIVLAGAGILPLVGAVARQRRRR